MSTLLKAQIRSIVVALSATLFVSCSSDQVASGPNVEARWKACSDSTGAPANRTVLENVVWVDGKLVINVKDNDYCGGTRVSNPGYTISGNRVQLRWTWEVGPQKAVTACACDHAIRFELSNIPAGDYQVQLTRTR